MIHSRVAGTGTCGVCRLKVVCGSREEIRGGESDKTEILQLVSRVYDMIVSVSLVPTISATDVFDV